MARARRAAVVGGGHNGLVAATMLAGAGWSVDPTYGSRRMRLCFGHPPNDVLREGVGVLAEVVAAETGLDLPS